MSDQNDDLAQEDTGSQNPAPDIEELLRFDPMKEDESQEDESQGGQSRQAEGAGEEAEAKQAGTESEGSSEEAQQGVDESEDKGKPSKSGEPESEEMRKLRDELEQTKAQLAEVQKQQGDRGSSQAQSQGSDQSASSDQEQIPSYEFQIPNEIVESLASEDSQQRQAGLQKLVQGVGRSVHQTIREEMDQKLENVSKQVKQETQEETRADQIQRDYFGAFPHHDNEVLKPLVQRVSQQVMRERNVHKWTDTVRDEIGKRVDEEARKAGFRGLHSGESDSAGHSQSGQAGESQTKGNGQAGQPHMRSGQNSRPAPSSGGTNTTADIEKTLFG